jgi:hypothetical protein
MQGNNDIVYWLLKGLIVDLFPIMDQSASVYSHFQQIKVRVSRADVTLTPCQAWKPTIVNVSASPLMSISDSEVAINVKGSFLSSEPNDKRSH